MLLGFVETIIIFLYAIRYYLFTVVSLRTETFCNPIKHGNPAEDNCNQPSSFITILLPLYNEPNVVDRLMRACTSFHSPQYEVVVIDDSDDGETGRKLKAWRDHPNVKVIHRNSRRGWKAGALNTGLGQMDPRSTHVLVLDADFIPPSDLLERFLLRFTDEKIAAVQGYQKHDLNAEENWITKGIRVLFSMDYIVEFHAKKRMGLFVQLTGSVYMIRTDVLRRLKYTDDITEDWNLTLRLYEEGYKIIYDSTLAVSGECPSTLIRFLKQRTRWAEGHTRNFRRHFWKVLKSKSITLREKIDFLFIGSAYLNSILVAIFTFAGLLTVLFPNYVSSIPYAKAGTFLVSICMPSAIIASLVALLKERAKGDVSKIPYAFVLNYITFLVTAYAALKGLFTNNGYFHRTYKTGKVTRKNLDVHA